MAEGCVGTNPSRPDTDGDGLNDGEDVWRGCEPLLADTDGDGWEDGAEAAAGASCREEEDVPGFHSVFECEPVMEVGLPFPAEHYYPRVTYLSGLGGDYCSCSLEVGGAAAVPALGGISLFQSVGSLGDTSWATDPFPLAVLAVAPSGVRYLSEGTGTGDAIVDAVVDGEVNWMAFSEPALEDSVSAETSVVGTWEFVFSLVQRGASATDPGVGLSIMSDGPSLTCAPFRDRADFTGVRVRFDPPPSHAIAAPALPPSDPRACTPGGTATTRFTIVDVGPRPRLVRTGGSERYAGARPLRARVVDWRGAERLEARLPGGASSTLGEGTWSPLPPASGFPDLRWAATRASEGAWRSPVVEIDHRCEVPAAVSLQPRYRLSWAEADAAGRALAGVGLAASLGADLSAATPLHLSVWHPSDTSPALLQVISPGVGALLTLRLAPDGPGAHRVVGGLPDGLELDARVVESAAALQVEVRGGTWTSPIGTLSLGAVRLRLPRVGG
jgi:hypothetical protein